MAGVLGDAAPSAQRIAQEFAALRYTGRAVMTDEVDEDDGDEMERAWRSIRGILIGRTFRRLLPGGAQR